MILLAVNYHYLAKESPPAPRAIFPVTTGAFAAQLELLAGAFTFVSRDELLAALDGGPALPERSCLITFDDGLREQAELALPVLERLGVPAIFFVPGLPLEEGRALYVHKVHALRERLHESEFESLLHEALSARSIDPPSVDDEQARAHYRYDAPEAARVKYLLNMALPADAREPAIDELFARVFTDERDFCERLYMDAAQVCALERQGALGSHGYSHRPLALLSPEDAAADLARGADVLERVAGARPRAVSYPHGTRSTVDGPVARAAADAGFRLGLTMERALNRSLEQPLLLARVDANDAPGGKRPRLELDGGEVRALDGVAPARSAYLDETVTA
ncbi:MAG: hypothetical protein QOE36_3702 [Gaiellaceae bacterium]|nr:hypothetical protein [Gaiellaceae bacterium]